MRIELGMILLLGGAVACSKNNEKRPDPEPAPAASDRPEHGSGGAAANPHDSPQGVHPPNTAAMAKAMEAAEGGGVQPTGEDGVKSFGPFTMQIPEGWEESPPSSSMRMAQFQIGSDAELVVYYFGAQGAGGVEANLDRWYGQFQQPDGRPSKDVARTETAKVDGFPVTTVEVKGRYVAAMQPGQAAKHDKPDHAMWGAIVETDVGPYYFKAVGPAKVIEGQKKQLASLVASLHAPK